MEREYWKEENEKGQKIKKKRKKSVNGRKKRLLKERNGRKKTAEKGN